MTYTHLIPLDFLFSAKMDDSKEIYYQYMIHARKTSLECIYGLDDKIKNIANGRTVDNKSFCYKNRYRYYKAKFNTRNAANQLRASQNNESQIPM